MIGGAWRLGFRLARRDALAARGRTALTVLLIGLPVLVLTLVDVGYRTYQLDPHETLARGIGTADVAVRWSGLNGDVQQGPQGWLSDDGTSVSGSDDGATPTAATIAALLPTGARIIAWNVADGGLTFRTRAGLDRATFTGLDLADPLTHGMARISSGRAPRTTGEVALTTDVATRSGLHVGDRLQAVGPARSYRVVGLVTDGSVRHPSGVYALPAAVRVDPDGLRYDPDDVAGWLGRTARPVTWDDVRRLNRAGFAVVSRAEYLRPSPAAVAAGKALAASSDVTTTAVPIALVAGMALLEVVLLAGPAFAVGAKRRRRDLALLAAAGATARQLQRVVLWSGALLGLLAGVVGVGLGVLAARLGEPLLATHVDDRPGPFQVPLWELAGLVAVAVITALAASVAPARAAARTEVVAALAGRRGETRVRRRTPVLGLVLVGVGAAISLTASVGSSAVSVILAGVVLVELGLIACTPALIVLAARAGRRLPLPARLALRDAGRNRSAATPAVAAVMAAVIGATALLLGVAAQDDRDARQYTPSLPAHAVSADVPGLDDSAAAALAARLGRALPATTSVVVRGTPSTCPPGVTRCTVRYLSTADDGSSSRIHAVVGDSIIVSDGSDVAGLLGRDAPAVSAALRAGRAVVADGSALRHGQVGLDLLGMRVSGPFGNDDGKDTSRRVDVPAVAVTSGYLPAEVIVPASVADRLRLDVRPEVVFVRTSRLPTASELQAARAAYRQVVPAGEDLYVEQGYRSRYAALEFALVSVAVLVAVLGAIVATALANVDGREDLRTLGAIGAAPRVRRSLSGARAAVIAGLGTLVGVPAGALVPLTLLRQSHAGPHTASSVLHFVVPWTSVVALIVAVPLIAGVLATALTRSRLPSGATG